MEDTHGNQAIRATMNNPFVVLDTELYSAGKFSTEPCTSSGGSVWQRDYATGDPASTAPSRGFNWGDSTSAQQTDGMHGVSAAQLREGSINIVPSPMSSTFTTPGRGRAQTTAEYISTSPHQVTTPRSHGSLTSYGSPQVISQRRGSTLAPTNHAQTPPSGRSGSSRASFSSSMRAPTLQQHPNAQSLTGIPQILAVQEMAFQQGQHDHGVSRERIPSSPFAMHFNQVWVEFYALGKESGGTRKGSSSSTEASPSHNNFPWPVLINPYTQDLEHPNGTVDSQWVRKMCKMALNCMEALVHSVCKRQGDWRRTTCDVPVQIRDALMSFDDLRDRYDQLKRDALEAVAGGLPTGYSSSTALRY
ncbi:hypothetical protein DE146DRAFT_754614 [Phaeosphaeria sp. MPI-PUGE-AT-0046c]|nr:hypothetical protein DE146DRAFT_754614 [Phaeosphaeria sp. MPI-PUGE-AT-0046c]